MPIKPRVKALLSEECESNWLVKEEAACSEKRLEILDLYAKDLAEDSMFPFKVAENIFVKVSFKLGDDELLIEKWEGTEKQLT